MPGKKTQDKGDRPLDVFIGKALFDMRVVSKPSGNPKYRKKYRLEYPGGKPVGWPAGGLFGCGWGSTASWFDCPSYTKSHDWAWKAVDKARSMNILITVDSMGWGYLVLVQKYRSISEIVFAETVKAKELKDIPLAICRAIADAIKHKEKPCRKKRKKHR